MLLRSLRRSSTRIGFRSARASSAAATGVSASTRATVAALAANLRGGADVEDFALTYGVPRNACIAPGGPVRPLCVVKVGGEVVAKDLPRLVASLKFLADFGLLPVVVHGGGPQLNDELAKAGVEPQYIGGHRVTDAPTLAVARRVFEGANASLAGALRAAGLPVRQFLGGVFHAEIADAKLGLVGRITSVDATLVNDAIAKGEIPVLTSLGIRPAQGGGDDGTLNINADVAARDLAIALQPLRVCFISAGGGWKEDGVVIDELDMAADFERMANRDYTGRQGTLLKLKEMKAIVDALPPVASVTICSPAALAAQLLPQRGPGTQIRSGCRVLKFDSSGAVDLVRLDGLLQACGATAAATLLRESPMRVARIYATEDYGSAAVIVHGAATPLLHTIVANATAMSAGAEATLWKALRNDYPSLAWLSSASRETAACVVEVAAKGTAHIPIAFPAQSVNRALLHAEGTLSLGGGTVAMWWGTAGSDGSAARVAAIVGALREAHAAAGGEGGVTVASAAAATPRPVTGGSSAAGARAVRVGLLGARGYVGRELLRLVAGHESLQVVCASSRALVGQPVAEGLGVPAAGDACVPGLTFSDVGPDELARGAHPPVDVWVLALPNGLCATHEAAIASARVARGAAGGPAPLLLDLSADKRFDTSGEWVYGLPEASREARVALRRARKISNPGCYATGAQMALLPLLTRNTPVGGCSWRANMPPHVFGVSGYSGAGTTPSDKNDPARLRDNLLAYSLTGHIHEKEVGHHCGLASSGGVAFMPHVAPFFQGIHLTVSGYIAPGTAPISRASLAERYASFYAGERLVRVLGEKETPDVQRHGTGQHGVTLGGWTWDAATGRFVLVSCIDNLLKGAATQAVQNINLACGLDEYEGIPGP